MSDTKDRLLLTLSIEVSAASEALAVVDSFERYLRQRYPKASVQHRELDSDSAAEFRDVQYQKASGGGEFLIQLQIPILFQVTGSDIRPLEYELTAIQQIMKAFRDRMQMIADLKGLSYTDDVTGLYNQRYLELILERELSLAKRNDGTFSVLFLDLDYFKNINDSYGHLVGSRLLFDVGQEIKRTLRESDITFRYGGDEFVIILAQTGLDDAMMVSERIRVQIEKKRFLVKEGHEIRLTASIGVATVPLHANNKQQILKAADEALYGTKKLSRNKVSASNAKPEE